MNIEDIVSGVVVGDHSGLVVSGRGGLETPDIVGLLRRRCEEAALPFRLVRGARLRASERYGAVEDLIGIDLLDALLDDPSRRDLAAARERVVEGLDPGMLVVTDAQWVDPATIALLAGLDGRRETDGLRLVVTQRPRPERRDLAALGELLGVDGETVHLRSLDESASLARLGDALVELGDQARIGELVLAAAGSPALLDAILEDVRIDGEAVGRWLSDGGEVPASLMETVRAATGHLSSSARELLVALSFGADPTSPAFTALLPEHGTSDLGPFFAELLDEGLLREGGTEVVPIVAEVVAALEPVLERSRHHRRFADALEVAGGSAAERAEHLRDAKVARSQLAPACLTAAVEVMDGSPELALAWLDEAEDAGAGVLELAVPRIDAHLRLGQPHRAIPVAEPLFRTEVEGRVEALHRIGIAFFQERRPEQASRVFRQIAPHAVEGVSEVATLSGDLCDILLGRDASDRKALTGRSESFEPALEVGRLLLESLRAVLDGDVAQAVDAAAGALHLESTLPGPPRLPISAASTAPMVAMLAADVEQARRLAQQALQRPAATDGQRRIRSAMGALIDGWAGRSEVLRFDERDRGGFEHLLVTAVRVGSARRANDLGALRNAQEVILHAVMQPPDLLAIPVHGELMVAAARLGEIERVDEARARRDERFPADARSPLLELGCVWIDLQIASAVDGTAGTDQLAALRSRLVPCRALDGRAGRFAETLSVWCDVLEFRADAGQVVEASQTLQQLGYAWEATRLVGAAALRLEDHGSAKELLATARELRASLQEVGNEAAPLSARLSARELEVAEALVDGNTYKEIGAALFISPKTVEHHVARIRQRLGAASRSELLDILRNEFARTADGLRESAG